MSLFFQKIWSHLMLRKRFSYRLPFHTGGDFQRDSLQFWSLQFLEKKNIENKQILEHFEV